MLIKNLKYVLLIKISFLLMSGSIFWYIYFFTDNIHTNSYYEKKITFIVDVSHSMNTQDIVTKYWLKISRLDASKKIISDTILENKDYKYWVIIFSRNSNYYIPPTYDTWTLLNYINEINTNIIPAGWSDIAGALKTFNNNTDEKNIGILLSDLGDARDLTEQQPNLPDIVKSILQKKQKIYILWLWSRNWDIIKYPDNQTIKQYDKPIVSKINNEYWNILAKNLNTQYIEINDLENSNYLWNIDLIDSWNISTKTSKVLEIIWTFLWILWI